MQDKITCYWLLISFENMENFSYLETVTNYNCFHEEIKSRLNSKDTCYHSVQNLLSYRLFSKNLKNEIHENNFTGWLLWV
jgi:hypothetical protein